MNWNVLVTLPTEYDPVTRGSWVVEAGLVTLVHGPVQVLVEEWVACDDGVRCVCDGLRSVIRLSVFGAPD